MRMGAANRNTYVQSSHVKADTPNVSPEQTNEKKNNRANEGRGGQAGRDGRTEIEAEVVEKLLSKHVSLGTPCTL